MDVFEAINKGDWQKVKDNVVQGKVGKKKGRARAVLFPLPLLPLHAFRVSKWGSNDAGVRPAVTPRAL